MRTNRWIVAIALLLAGCAVTTPGAPLDGDWGISGAAGECGFYAFAQITGTAEDFAGTAEMDGRTVQVAGSASTVQVGPLTLTVAEAHPQTIAGTFLCGGAPGAWSMYRYP